MGKSETRQKDVYIALRCTAKEKAVVEELARQKGISVSSLMRLAIFDYYESETGRNLAAAAIAKGF